MSVGWKVESWLICDDTRHRQVNIGGNYTMVQISAVLGIVCYNTLAGGILVSTKADRGSMLCMEGDYDIGQDAVYEGDVLTTRLYSDGNYMGVWSYNEYEIMA